MKIANDQLKIMPEVAAALAAGQPVLALESTILSHGLPHPENLDFAGRAESLIRKSGAVPATIAIVNGHICVGLAAADLESLSAGSGVEKISRRDISRAVAQALTGGTTVAATLAIAHSAGIKVFATGGIGGVHRGWSESLDVSQDIAALAAFPLVVVSAGAKAILDLPKTLEALETAGVPVAGYQTDEFPAFYSRSAGLPVPVRVESALEIAVWYRRHRELGMTASILIANPIPVESELSRESMDEIINAALADCRRSGITGKAVTPFLLKAIVEKTGGASLLANLALAMNNIRLGCEIASCLSG